MVAQPVQPQAPARPQVAPEPRPPVEPRPPKAPAEPKSKAAPRPPAEPKSKPPATGVPNKKHGHRALWISLVTVIVVLALVVGGLYVWSTRSNTDTPTVPQTMSTVPAATPTLPPPPDPIATWPLTGLPMADDASNGPALCIKIENSVQARPQLGLDSADIVIEEVVEGGITRFMGVFQSTIPKQVEPVRSLRPMDTPLAQQFSCALVFSGGQLPFVQAALNSVLPIISQDRGAMWFSRDSGRSAPHNVIGDMATFMATAKAAKLTSPPPAFNYPALGQVSSIVADGAPATRLDLKMSGVESSTWRWDDVHGVWLRYEGTTKATVVGGKQLSATNVVTLSVTLVNTQYRDPAGNPVPETQIVGSGTGTVSYAGMSMPIKWSKASAKKPIVLTDASGNPVTLLPGNTWVELVPKSGSVTIR